MKATNAEKMKNSNRRLILDHIRKNNCSRADLAKELGLTRAALSIIINDMLGQGILREESSHTERVGRNPSKLFLQGDSCYFVGIDINRTGFTCGMVDLCGKIILSENYSIITAEEFFQVIAGIMEGILKKTGIPMEKIYAIGVSVPGPLDVKEGRVLQPTNFGGWHNVPVLELMKKTLHFDRIYLENVSHAVALAEQYFGIMQNTREDNFISLWMDGGLGSGIVQKGKLFRGISELGHTSVDPRGIPCACGNIGCLERYASIGSIMEAFGYSDWNEASRNMALLNREADYLALALCNICNIFDLDIVILPRNLVENAPILLDLIQHRLDQHILLHKPPMVRESALTHWIQGPSAVAMYHYFSK